MAKELNSAMSDLPSFDSGLVSAVLKDMWSKVNMKIIVAIKGGWMVVCLSRPRRRAASRLPCGISSWRGPESSARGTRKQESPRYRRK